MPKFCDGNDPSHTLFCLLQLVSVSLQWESGCPHSLAFLGRSSWGFRGLILSDNSPVVWQHDLCSMGIPPGVSWGTCLLAWKQAVSLGLPSLGLQTTEAWHQETCAKGNISCRGEPGIYSSLPCPGSGRGLQAQGGNPCVSFPFQVCRCAPWEFPAGEFL